MDGCDRDEDGNLIDPITLDVIPLNRLVTFEQLGKTFCFDVASLAKLREPINPLNRMELPRTAISAIEAYKDTMTVMLILYYNGDFRVGRISMDDSVGTTLIAIHRMLGQLENIGKDDVVYGNNEHSLYSVSLTSHVGPLIREGTIYVKVVPTYPVGVRRRMRLLYRYAIANHITWLREIIPEEYHNSPPQSRPYSNTDQVIISNYVLNGIERIRRGEPVRDTYFTVGVARLLHGAHISARFAEIIARYMTIYGEGRWDSLTDIIYGRVVDLHMLPTSHPYYEPL